MSAEVRADFDILSDRLVVEEYETWELDLRAHTLYVVFDPDPDDADDRNAAHYRQWLASQNVQLQGGHPIAALDRDKMRTGKRPLKLFHAGVVGP